MKIFAKRTKKADSSSPSPAKSTTSTPDKNHHASDKIVEEDILKKDPSKWNAKERRMVKRYQDRKSQETTEEENIDVGESKPSSSLQEDAKDAAPTKDEIINKEKKETEDQEDISEEFESEELEEQPQAKKQKTQAASMESQEESPISSSLESVLDSSVLEHLNSKQRRKLSRMLLTPRTGDEAVSLEDIRAEAKNLLSGEADAEKTDNNNNPKEADSKNESSELVQVHKLLEGLNSKLKRKLTRKLEREGENCLAQVKEEAEQLLKAASSTETPKNETKEGVENSSSIASSVSGRKRRRGTADLSSLTPEERLRREEQRRMQKEAAERRENGEDSSSAEFKHPLNSERRRANRRKPKWKPKKAFAKEQKIEHNASGYHVRKMKNT